MVKNIFQNLSESVLHVFCHLKRLDKMYALDHNTNLHSTLVMKYRQPVTKHYIYYLYVLAQNNILLLQICWWTAENVFFQLLSGCYILNLYSIFISYKLTNYLYVFKLPFCKYSPFLNFITHYCVYYYIVHNKHRNWASYCWLKNNNYCDINIV